MGNTNEISCPQCLGHHCQVVNEISTLILPIKSYQHDEWITPKSNRVVQRYRCQCGKQFDITVSSDH